MITLITESSQIVPKMKKNLLDKNKYSHVKNNSTNQYEIINGKRFLCFFENKKFLSNNLLADN
ncbi:MAG TPA: hypothetical protein DDE71_00940 [Tenacibaculum sp.]|nr:hypothetical protein [Tenacibaculum sp.]